MERVTEQMKQRKRRGWPIRLHLDSSQFGGTPLCVGLFTLSHQQRREGELSEGMAAFVSMSQGSTEGDFSEAETHLGGVVSVCLI